MIIEITVTDDQIKEVVSFLNKWEELHPVLIFEEVESNV